MTYINWDEPFYLNTRTLATSTSPEGRYSVPIPTYGNHGGPEYTQGDFGENPLQQPTSGERPLDALDRQFFRHDVASALAGNDLAVQNAADLAVIQRIVGLSDEKLADPEAGLYGGLATLVFIAEIAENGARNQFLVARQALPDALDNITSSVAELPFGERLGALLFLEQATDVIESDGRKHILDKAADALEDYFF